MRYQEAALYFLIEFAPGSTVLIDRDGPFEGTEPGTVFQWIPLDEVEQANLLPGVSSKACTGDSPRTRSTSSTKASYTNTP